MSTYKNTFISLIILLALGLTAWSTLLSYRSQSTSGQSISDVPDAFMEDVTAIIMNKQGKPNMKIVTPKMIHYPTSDTTQLISPELTIYRKSPQPWRVTAQYAKATNGIDNVLFWKDVNVSHAADGDSPPTLIQTTTLMVHPNQQTAETADFITLSQPNTIVKAVGMQADMNTGNIKLLSQARGEYVPNS